MVRLIRLIGGKLNNSDRNTIVNLVVLANYYLLGEIFNMDKGLYQEE